MNDASIQQVKQPTTAQLLKASAIALLVAVIILLTAVLPAEFGKDPTGIGAALGLTALYSAHEQVSGSQSSAVASGALTPVATPSAVIAGQALPGQPAPAQTDPAQADSAQTDPAQSFNLDAVRVQSSAFRSDEMSVTLEAGKGAEIKAKMQEGGAFVFSWTSLGGPVNFDMHGEKPNDGDKFTSYWLDNQKAEGHGRFIAPFTGVHGWYWQNKGAVPVTITVKVSGYFEPLYRPH